MNVNKFPMNSYARQLKDVTIMNLAAQYPTLVHINKVCLMIIISWLNASPWIRINVNQTQIVNIILLRIPVSNLVNVHTCFRKEVTSKKLISAKH